MIKKDYKQTDLDERTEKIWFLKDSLEELTSLSGDEINRLLKGTPKKEGVFGYMYLLGPDDVRKLGVDYKDAEPLGFYTHEHYEVKTESGLEKKKADFTGRKDMKEMNLELFRELYKLKTKREDKKSKEEIELEKVIVEKNLGLVIMLTNSFNIPYGNVVEREDLTGVGVIALYKAIEGYDINKLNPKTQESYSFSSYAVPCIKRSMSAFLRTALLHIEIPDYMFSLLKKGNSTPNSEKLANFARLALRRALSLNQPISKESGIKHFGLDGLDLNLPLLEEFIGSETHGLQEYIEDSTQSRLLSRQIEELFDSLSPREEKILRMRYGIDEKREHTNTEIGEDFKLSRQNVWRIEKKSIKNLRHPSKSRLLRQYFEDKE